MTYEYHCRACDHWFDVIKSYKDMERNENCPECGEFGFRQFVPSKVSFNSTSVQNAEYNPAFGEVVKNKRHREDLAKRKGMVEVGNDYGSAEKMQKHFDEVREKKREDRWNKDD